PTRRTTPRPNGFTVQGDAGGGGPAAPRIPARAPPLAPNQEQEKGERDEEPRGDVRSRHARGAEEVAVRQQIRRRKEARGLTRQPLADAGDGEHGPKTEYHRQQPRLHHAHAEDADPRLDELA